MLEEVEPVPLSDSSAAGKVLDIVGCPWHPAFAIIPSTLFQTIPRPLQMPLSLIHPEHMQVSWVSASDLDMALYVFPLRLRKLSSDRRD